MVAGLASALGSQARGTVLLEAAQQTKHLTPPQADQLASISYPQPAALHPQQYLKAAELLLAHRHHRHGAPRGTPEPAGVSPLSCSYREGRKIRLMEIKNCSFPRSRNDGVFFGKQRRYLFRAGRFRVVFFILQTLSSCINRIERQNRI